MFSYIKNFLYPNSNTPIDSVVVKPDPKILIFLDKSQINTESYFLPFYGKHNLVRHFVIFNPQSEERSIYGFPAWMGHSQKVSTEMIALGCKNKIDSIMEVLLNEYKKLPEVILFQTTGYYPLGIFINVDLDSSRVITDDEAKELLKKIEFISIANID